MNKEKQPQAEEISTHTSSSDQETAPLPNPQQEAPVLRPSGPDATMVATRGSQDVSAQQCSSILYILIMIKSGWLESGNH